MLIANIKTNTKGLFGQGEKWGNEKQRKEYERKHVEKKKWKMS